MNRFIKIFIGIAMLVFTTGCTTSNVFKSEKEIMEEILEYVLLNIENEDSEAMKSLFSKKSLSEVENFEEDMNYLIDFFKGDVIDWEVAAGPGTSERLKSGKKWIEIKIWYSIETTENNYVMFILNYDRDDFEPENEGLYSIRVVLEENRDTEMTVWQDMKIPGIYNPNNEDISVIN